MIKSTTIIYLDDFKDGDTRCFHAGKEYIESELDAWGFINSLKNKSGKFLRSTPIRIK